MSMGRSDATTGSGVKPLRILVAEDHEKVRHQVCALLETKGGFQGVAEVSNGREAVDKAQELQPKVVVMDSGGDGHKHAGHGWAGSGSSSSSHCPAFQNLVLESALFKSHCRDCTGDRREGVCRQIRCGNRPHPGGRDRFRMPPLRKVLSLQTVGIPAAGYGNADPCPPGQQTKDGGAPTSNIS